MEQTPLIKHIRLVVADAPEMQESPLNQVQFRIGHRDLTQREAQLGAGPSRTELQRLGGGSAQSLQLKGSPWTTQCAMKSLGPALGRQQRDLEKCRAAQTSHGLPHRLKRRAAVLKINRACVVTIRHVSTEIVGQKFHRQTKGAQLFTHADLQRPGIGFIIVQFQMKHLTEDPGAVPTLRKVWNLLSSHRKIVNKRVRTNPGLKHRQVAMPRNVC